MDYSHRHSAISSLQVFSNSRCLIFLYRNLQSIKKTIHLSEKCWRSKCSFFYTWRRGTKNFTVFSDQGIPGPKPVPFLGNAWGMWKQVRFNQYDSIDQHGWGYFIWYHYGVFQNFQTSGREQVKKYGKVFGSFLSTAPSLNTIDTELIKSVFVKDFDHFINKRVTFNYIELI